MAETFSLKDALFNKAKVELLASQITQVYPSFDSDSFIATVVTRFPELELKQRISWICENLRAYLPKEYRAAVAVILKALPPELDHTKNDNDFGDFIYAPYNEFLARYGCTKHDLMFSLGALREVTKRFSAEDAIRYFINAFPEETFATLADWATDPNYHVRRLVSEGTRPKLPWSQKIVTPVEKPIPFLTMLFFDSTRYVTRSVANHMNDISKVQPQLVLETLNRWEKSGKQKPLEMEYIIKHSLRTLVKQGHSGAIEFLKFSADPQVDISELTIATTHVRVGEALVFSFTLTARKDERLIVDYVIYFQSKTGTLTNKKVFKIKQYEVQNGAILHIKKRHPLRVMTTRILYPGKHIVEVQVNGKKVGSKEFEIVA